MYFKFVRIMTINKIYTTSIFILIVQFAGATLLIDPPKGDIKKDSSKNADTNTVAELSPEMDDELVPIYAPEFLLTPEYYKNRYTETDLMYKVVDNWGNGFDSLYGTRNMRTILHGVAYRGGSNNYFHKTAKRNNHNPIPPDGMENLCEEGFSRGIYLYRANFENSKQGCNCNAVNNTSNDFNYHQYDYFDDKHVYEMLKLVYESAVDDHEGPVYLHCWNGWHASGFISAVILKQFCGMSDLEAVNYWDLGTDGANTSPRFQKVRDRIKNFKPYKEFLITDELGNRICAPMPEFIDSSQLHIDISHLAIVPEAIPVGYDIVLYNVKFGPNKTSIYNADSNKDLQELVKALSTHKDLEVQLNGYTDKSGDYSKNVALSKSRAKFVHDYLIKKGIDASRLSYNGYGPKKYLYSNKSKSGRAGNRRIEVKIVKKKIHSSDKIVDEVGHETIDAEQKHKNEAATKPKIANDIETFEKGMAIVLGNVVFEPNMTNISDPNSKDLLDLVEKLKSNKKLVIEVAGHTDASGIKEKNDSLSTARAQSVYNYLVEKGVSEKQISYKGYGPSKPIATNKYRWGRDLNRRIEVIIKEI